jgi:hypothetical protein
MTSTYDFNNADPQRSFDVIPQGTIVTVRMKVRPGDAGERGWLRRSKDGNSEALDCEFVLLDGPFAKRKFWTLFTVAGTTPGHVEAAGISNSILRAILESARGLKPKDNSDAAKEARRISSYGDFNGLRFVARIGVEPPQNGYEAKNRLDRAITPDEKAWHPVTQEPAPAGASAPTTSAKPASTPAKIERPAWAKE